MSICYRQHIYITSNDDISSDALIATELINQGNFFGGLEHIGYAIALLVSDDPNEDYNSTDCITTAKSLTKLFLPITKPYKVFSGNHSEELKYLLSINNFVDVKVSVLGYHRFILVKINNLWYMMGSYGELYTLRIKQVDAYHILTNMNGEMYSKLFDDLVINDNYAILHISIGNYSSNYIDRLLMLLSKHISY